MLLGLGLVGLVILGLVGLGFDVHGHLKPISIGSKRGQGLGLGVHMKE